MAGDPFDIFGPSPMGPRPTHRDFARLVDIILRQDGRTEDATFDMDAHLAAVVDPASVSYVALQRGFRLAALMGVDPRRSPGMAVQLASLWGDAFMVGAAFMDRGGEATA